jgi:hypothetical protein
VPRNLLTQAKQHRRSHSATSDNRDVDVADPRSGGTSRRHSAGSASSRFNQRWKAPRHGARRAWPMSFAIDLHFDLSFDEPTIFDQIAASVASLPGCYDPVNQLSTKNSLQNKHQLNSELKIEEITDRHRQRSGQSSRFGAMPAHCNQNASSSLLSLLATQTAPAP